MLSFYVLILLLKCKAALTYDIVVTRDKNADTFSPLKECAECSSYDGYCKVSNGQCCEKCSCQYGMSIFEQDGQKKCVKDIGHKEECEYHLRGSEHPHQSTFTTTLLTNAKIKIGILTATKKPVTHLSDCTILEKDSKYWDLFRGWLPLFGGTFNSRFFSLQRRPPVTTLNFHTSSEQVESFYEGLLVKLKLRCTEKQTKIMIVKDSCLVFKISGHKTYIQVTPLATTTTTTNAAVVNTTIIPESESHSVIIIVLITLLVTAFIIAAVAIYLWRRKKRKPHKEASFERISKYRSKKKLLRKDHDDEESIYQAPELNLENGKTVNEVGNPAYLQPIDSKQPQLENSDGAYQDPNNIPKRNGKGEPKGRLNKKDAGYDYPQIGILPMTKSAKTKNMLESPSKHVYADISVEEALDPHHPYTDPDKYLESRKSPLSTGGYASIDESELDCNNPAANTGYARIDESDNSKKPPMERYASLNVSIDENLGDIANPNVTGQGYAKLDSSTLGNNQERKYFELEKEDNDNENTKVGNVDKLEPKYFELNEEEAI